MPVSPHIARLRQTVGHDLLLLPTVAVLPIDPQGRVLLVRQTDFGTFGTVGGAIEEDESPYDAATREAREEIGVEVEIVRLIDVVGGPQFRITYPNGDQVACVSIVYEARIPDHASVSPDGDEVDFIRWFSRSELTGVEVGNFAQETFAALKSARFGPWTSAARVPQNLHRDPRMI